MAAKRHRQNARDRYNYSTGIIQIEATIKRERTRIFESLQIPLLVSVGARINAPVCVHTCTLPAKSLGPIVSREERLHSLLERNTTQLLKFYRIFGMCMYSCKRMIMLEIILYVYWKLSFKIIFMSNGINYHSF